ncbi:MAG TPA: plastocyanin/azurin family copper-binding protein [Gemmatimonadales bacterium]|nr:plastocyanin/azurin family copper-binding protein [Gemmatimonadales bacterium]
MSRTHGGLAMGGLALAAILVACFSEHTPAGPDNSTLCSSPSGSVVNGSTLVIIREFAFQTQNVTVPVGTSVTWVNCETSGTAHTSTSDQNGWSSPLLASADAFTQTFDTPGVFPYHCDPHPFMTGTVTVE